MWEINNASQLIAFLTSLAVGCVFCLIYDIFRAIRKSFNRTRYAVFFEDILYSLICGVIGFLYAGAISHTVSEKTATLGFTAILIAWLGKFNPLIMIGTALFVVVMQTGTGQINTDFSLGSTDFSNMIIGIVFFFVIGCEFFITYSIKAAGGWKEFTAKAGKFFKRKKTAETTQGAGEAANETDRQTEDEKK